MDNEFLKKVGLTDGEVKVFTALNILGETTVGPITKESGVSKSKIYDILEKLISKGLAGYVFKDKSKHFFVNSPTTLIDYIAKKENELKQTKKEVENIIPQLLAQRNSQNTQRVAEIYEGFRGLKTIREELLNEMDEKDTLLVMGAPTIANELWEHWLLNFHKVRISKKIGMKILYNSDAKKYGVVRKKMEYTTVKYLPKNITSLMWIDVFKNAIMFGIVLDKPIAFVVRSNEARQSLENYFNILWKEAKN